MILTNITSNKVISDKVQVARSLAEKTLGLMDPRNSRFLVIHTRFGIHTFFLKEKIDIVLLNKNSRVVRLISDLNPNRILFYHPRINTVIEMPAGTIKRKAILLNDKISIE